MLPLHYTYVALMLSLHCLCCTYAAPTLQLDCPYIVPMLSPMFLPTLPLHCHYAAHALPLMLPLHYLYTDLHCPYVAPTLPLCCPYVAPGNH